MPRRLFLALKEAMEHIGNAVDLKVAARCEPLPARRLQPVANRRQDSVRPRWILAEPFDIDAGVLNNEESAGLNELGVSVESGRR